MLSLPPLTVRSRGTGEGIRGAGRRRMRVAPVVGGAGRRPRPRFRCAEWPRIAPRGRCLLLWFPWRGFPWRWGGRIRETSAPFQEAGQFRIQHYGCLRSSRTRFVRMKPQERLAIPPPHQVHVHGRSTGSRESQALKKRFERHRHAGCKHAVRSQDGVSTARRELGSR